MSDREPERRHGPRIPMQLWVEQTGPDGTYFNYTANLSTGGMFLDHTIPHPIGTIVQLQFLLPDEPNPIRVRAKIVSAETRDAMGMGLTFVDVPADVSARIAKFIADNG
jgi:uncharacterized protein (TIGR02266 family)